MMNTAREMIYTVVITSRLSWGWAAGHAALLPLPARRRGGGARAGGISCW